MVGVGVVVGDEVGVFWVPVVWATDVVAVVVVPEVVIVRGCAHGIEVGSDAPACCPVYVGVVVGVGFRIGLGLPFDRLTPTGFSPQWVLNRANGLRLDLLLMFGLDLWSWLFFDRLRSFDKLRTNGLRFDLEVCSFDRSPGGGPAWRIGQR